MIVLHFHLYQSSSHMNYCISYDILHAISLLTGDMNSTKLTSLPMRVFIAQLVEHRTGIVEVTGLNPVEAVIFSGFFFPIAQIIGKLTVMIILHFL